MLEQILREADTRREEILKVLPESALDKDGQILEGTELPFDKIKEQMRRLDSNARESVWARDEGRKYDKLTSAQSEFLRTLDDRLDGFGNYGEAVAAKRKAQLRKDFEAGKTIDRGDGVMQSLSDLKMFEIDTTQRNLRDALIYLGSAEDAQFILDKVDPQKDDEFSVMTRITFNYPELKGDVAAKFATEKEDAQTILEKYIETLVYRIGSGVMSLEEYHILSNVLDDVKAMVDSDKFTMPYMLPLALESKKFQEIIADEDLVREIIEKVSSKDK